MNINDKRKKLIDTAEDHYSGTELEQYVEKLEGSDEAVEREWALTFGDGKTDDDVLIAKFVDIANNYGGIEYGFNCKIVTWMGDSDPRNSRPKAVVTIEDQDDPEADQEKVQLSYDGETYRIEDMKGSLLATTNYPKVLFAILYA